VTETEFLALEGDVCVAAATGHATSEWTVENVMSGRPAELEELAGSG
jgi:hypothetical protein